MSELTGEITLPRLILAILILIHSLIHLIGVVREWNLADVNQLKGKTLFPLTAVLSKASGFLWLLSFLCFIAAASGLFFKPDLWWLPALVGTLISQTLIIVYWQDAKSGTVFNVLIFIIGLAGFGQWSFAEESRVEVRDLLATVKENPAVISADDLKDLPDPIRRWLLASGVVGKRHVQAVWLKQNGLMRTDPEGDWMPAEATQVFTVDEPGFIWTVDVTMAGVIPIAGRDRYRDGKGNMLIKALSLFPIVNGLGAKIDQGTLLRYLGEIVWFPSAALSAHIFWTPLDSMSARATMSYGDVTASADFHINEVGDVVACSAQRYMGDGETATLERWYVPSKEWKVMNGFRIPVKGDVIWKLASGDFTYYQWEIVQIEYDTRSVIATVP